MQRTSAHRDGHQWTPQAALRTATETATGDPRDSTPEGHRGGGIVLGAGTRSGGRRSAVGPWLAKGADREPATRDVNKVPGGRSTEERECLVSSRLADGRRRAELGRHRGGHPGIEGKIDKGAVFLVTYLETDKALRNPNCSTDKPSLQPLRAWRDHPDAGIRHDGGVHLPSPNQQR
jgi:hypothetical protein